MEGVLIKSCHPSRQNTNTGKLTEVIFYAVFARAKQVLRGYPGSAN
jgi:uracil-DNA glycosylase